MRIPDYPAPDRPLDGTEILPIWEGGQQRSIQLESLWLLAAQQNPAFKGVPGSGGRDQLTAPRNYFVSSAGSDSNDGLANTSDHAFLTYQAAINAAYALDCNGYPVIIQGAPGTYSGQISAFGPLLNPAADTPLTIIGDEVTPGNVIINTSNDAIKVTHGAYLCLKGIHITTSAGDAWTAETGGVIEHQNCEFGNVSGTIFAPHFFGLIKQIGGAVTMLGNADSFVHVTTRAMVRFTGFTVNFAKPGGCSFSTYLYGVNDATCDLDNCTIEGSVIAGKTTVHLNGKLNLAVASRAAFISNLLGPGPLTLGGDSNINITEWTSLNFYIDPAGSDNNAGIGPESYNAFKTINGALLYLRNIPFSEDRTNALNNSLLLHCANGNYAESVVPVDLPCWTSVKIVGTNGAANVTITGVNDAFFATALKHTQYTLANITITAPNAGCYGIRAERGAVILHDTCVFGACGIAQKFTDTGGQILNIGTTEGISGGAQYHAQAFGGGLIDLATIACTTTVTGTPAYSGAFVNSQNASIVRAKHTQLTYSGAATGQRYLSRQGGVIDTAGGGPTFFPGSTSGTADATTFGIYA